MISNLLVLGRTVPKDHRNKQTCLRTISKTNNVPQDLPLLSFANSRAAPTVVTLLPKVTFTPSIQLSRGPHRHPIATQGHLHTINPDTSSYTLPNLNSDPFTPQLSAPSTHFNAPHAQCSTIHSRYHTPSTSFIRWHL